MPDQELSLWAGFPSGELEPITDLLQTLTRHILQEFRTYTEVFNDFSEQSGRRPSNFIHFRTPLPDEKWTMMTFEAPEMAKRPVTARLMHVSPIHEGDHRSLAGSFGMKFAYGYFEQGYSIQIGLLTVLIYQIFKAVADEDGKTGPESEGHAIGSGQSWIVKASMMTSPDVQQQIKLGTDELLRLKRILTDHVELQVITDELR